jgi:ubiquinone/menaquinone biosynthesis C-methylase UbiE
MKEKEKRIEEIKKFRKYYNDTHANNYDKEWWCSEDALNEYKGFKKLVHVQPNEVVLDIATGTGTFLIEMAKSGGLCYGIDQSPKMLEQLKEKINRNNFEINIKDIRVCVADQLPYPDQFFDWVTCIGMFEYYPLEYVKQVFDEIIRVLKPNGKCLVDIPNTYDIKTQNIKWIFKYHLDDFERLIKLYGLKVLARNSAGYMFQYLLSRIQ